MLLFLSGEVPPEVTLPNRRMGQTLGRDTVLECVIMSSPQALYYWEKDGLQTWNSVDVRPFVKKMVDDEKEKEEDQAWNSVEKHHMEKKMVDGEVTIGRRTSP